MAREPLVKIDLGQVFSSEQLQQLLSEKLKFPEWYGRNWDAFWDAISGLVEMPEALRLIGWSEFETRLPRDAKVMKECLDDLSKEYPEFAARVEYA